jgi:ankyrin repeat protein
MGDITAAQGLLKRGASSNARDRLAQVPVLSMAVKRHQMEAVQLLLASGADVNGRSPQGRTALMTAATAGFSAVCPVLVAVGGR